MQEDIDIIIPRSHPRYESLLLRELLVKGWREGIVVTEGLLAHGRGECFDYLIGERSEDFALEAERAAAAALLSAKRPVISVNGNTAALAAESIVALAHEVGALLEVNLFYRTEERAKRIAQVLYKHGAEKVLGVYDATASIPGIHHARGKVSPHGIYVADTVMVPLEDGDRTKALKDMGKLVIAIDLNPLSRTAMTADITIVDNVVRAIPNITRFARQMKRMNRSELRSIVESYDNRKVLSKALRHIAERLKKMASEIELNTYV